MWPRAVRAVLDVNPQLALLQCNTNYTAQPGQLSTTYISAYSKPMPQMFPEVVLGLL